MYTKLYTIGYANRKLLDFIVTLRDVGITRIVDVMLYPRSYRQRKLADELNRNGIAYSSAPELDVDAGYKYKEDMRECYLSQLNLFSRKIRICEIAALVRLNLTALMGEEFDYRKCHREPLANKISELGNFEIIHL